MMTVQHLVQYRPQLKQGNLRSNKQSEQRTLASLLDQLQANVSSVISMFNAAEAVSSHERFGEMFYWSLSVCRQ